MIRGVTAPSVKHESMTWERIDKFISIVYFKEVNLTSKLFVGESVSPQSILHYKASGRFCYKDAVSSATQYGEAKVGDQFGPIWSTHWFRVEFQLPQDYLASLPEDQEVLFYWNSASEATIWDEKTASPVGAFSDGGAFGDVRDFIRVKRDSITDNKLKYLLEVACNKTLGEGDDLFIGVPNEKAIYILSECQLKIRHKLVYKLLAAFKLLLDISKELDDTDRGRQALYLANHCINVILKDGESAYNQCLTMMNEYFKTSNSTAVHTIHAIGHCHMDCAWLWPYDETKRKCGRSWAATLDLMDQYPEMNFACSSAQQYSWVETHYPGLFSRITGFVKAGRFIPVGGSWVEMDGNLPSGESMCRQLLFGQRYFKEKFNLQCTEFWLPDTFGYSPQLPQIMKHFNMNRFFTQKISWNLYNKFPHHTFYWRGIDGSSVLSHFAPGDSYHMKVAVSELIKTSDKFKDKGRSDVSLFLYGHGDGGQGPTQEMLEKLELISDCAGLPRIENTTPNKFFKHIEDTSGDNLCTWNGELYLEMHNGTYTTMAEIKKYNRQLESLLHNVEFISTCETVLHGADYPRVKINNVWKQVLLNQFHDVLPGTCIELAHKNAIEIYKSCKDELEGLLLKKMDGEIMRVSNTLCWERTEVITQDADPQLVKIPASSINLKVNELDSVGDYQSVKLCEEKGLLKLSNSKLSAWIDKSGRIVSLCCNDNMKRDFVKEGSPLNQLCMYDDTPLFWDAWDVMHFHQETRLPVECWEELKVVSQANSRVVLSCRLKLSEGNVLDMYITLDAESPFIRIHCLVDWAENRKMLKVEFPTDIISDHVTYETQFGHHRRPTHQNTSWDSAKYEVCCQRWFDLSDSSGGIAILNNCKYGCSVTNFSTLNLSLIRSTKYPDGNADMGRHEFSYAIHPHTGDFQSSGVIKSAYNFNNPLLEIQLDTTDELTSFTRIITVDNPAVIIETVKMGEDSNESNRYIILRIYESYGGVNTAEIKLHENITLSAVYRCDGLENQLNEVKLDKNSFEVTLSAFQVQTYKLQL